MRALTPLRSKIRRRNDVGVHNSGRLVASSVFDAALCCRSISHNPHADEHDPSACGGQLLIVRQNMIDDYRLNIDWYLNLNWGKWYSDNLRGWAKDVRKTDILMSAMFRAYKKQVVLIDSVIRHVGNPDWIEGNYRNGLLLYKLYRRADVDYYQQYMAFFVINGVLHKDNGTNLRLQFSRHRGLLLHVKFQHIRNFV